MSDSNDKIYIIIILAMVGFFVYFYQSKIDAIYEKTRCMKCERHKKKKKKKIVKHNDESEISLDSLDTSDKGNKDKDTASIDM